VAAVLVAEDAELPRERLDLRLPELARRPERARQDEHRRALGAVEAVRKGHCRSR